MLPLGFDPAGRDGPAPRSTSSHFPPITSPVLAAVKEAELQREGTHPGPLAQLGQERADLFVGDCREMLDGGDLRRAG